MRSLTKHSGAFRGIVAAPTIMTVLLGAAVLAPPAEAGVRSTWTGLDDYSWSNAANWSAGVPGPQDTAVISRDYQGACAWVDGDTITVGALELGECANLDTYVFTVADATLSGTSSLHGEVTVTHALTWTGNSIMYDNLTIPAGATMTSSGSGRREAYGLTTVHGTLVLDGGTTVNYNDGFVIDGTVRLDASSVIGDSTDFETSGPVQVGAHALTFDGHGSTASFLTSGTTTLSGGTVLLKDGMHEFREGARFAGVGLVKMVPTAGSGDTGTRLSNHGDLLLDPGITLEIAGGFQHDPMTLRGGTFSWTGGHLIGDVTLSPATTTTISGPAAKDISGSLVNQGQLTANGGSAIEVYNDGLRNEGTFTVAADTQLTSGGQVVSPGTIQLNSGKTLTVNGPDFLMAGTTNLSGATVLLQGGMHEFLEGAEFTGTGTVRVALAGGSVHTDTRLTGHGDLALDPGVVFEFAGGFQHDPMSVQGGKFSWTGGHLGNLTVGATTTATVSGDEVKSLGTLVNRGQLTFESAEEVELSTTLTNKGRLQVLRPTELTGGGGLNNTKKGQLTLLEALSLDGPELTSAGRMQLGTRLLALGAGVHTLKSTSVLGVGLDNGTGPMGSVKSAGKVALDGKVTVTTTGKPPAAGSTFTLLTAKRREGKLDAVAGSGKQAWTAQYTKKKVTLKAGR